MILKKEAFIATIDSYNSKSLFSRIQRKLSYFHKQLFIAYLKKYGKVSILNTKIIFGDTMKIVLPDNISIALYLVGFFEAEESKAFSKLMQPGYNFIDIGAHIGYYSVLANYLGGENAKIVAIEPTPSTFKFLSENVQKFANTMCFNIALYSKSGEMDFNDFGVENMCLNSFFDARLDHKIKGEKVKVKVKTLDNIIEDFNIKPDLIKIDAESAELEILKGAGKAFENKATFFVEVGDYNLENTNSSLKIIEYFESKDYKAFEFKEDNFVIHVKKHEKYPSMSLYFLPN